MTKEDKKMAGSVSKRSTRSPSYSINLHILIYQKMREVKRLKTGGALRPPPGKVLEIFSNPGMMTPLFSTEGGES
jgi:hypothetical protein